MPPRFSVLPFVRKNVDTQGPVGQLLLTLGRHNIRPSHLHIMIDAPGFHKLTTSLYPEGDVFLSSDAVFGVKRSLVVVSKRASAPFCIKNFASWTF